VQAALGRREAAAAPDPDDLVRLILGSVPPPCARRRAGARQALGTAVVFGMLFATLVGVFFIRFST